VNGRVREVTPARPLAIGLPSTPRPKALPWGPRGTHRALRGAVTAPGISAWAGGGSGSQRVRQGPACREGRPRNRLVGVMVEREVAAPRSPGRADGCGNGKEAELAARKRNRVLAFLDAADGEKNTWAPGPQFQERPQGASLASTAGEEIVRCSTARWADQGGV